MADQGGLPDLYDRLLDLSNHVGLGLSDDVLDGTFDVLLADAEGAGNGLERDELVGRTLSLRADHERHLGRPAAALDLHLRSAAAFEKAGLDWRSRHEIDAAQEQAVAAGQPLDAIVERLREQVRSLRPSAGRAAAAARLARITADLGDHFETRDLVTRAGTDLVAAGFVDPQHDPASAYETWVGAVDTDTVDGLRDLTGVTTTWLELLGLRGRLGDDAATKSLRLLAIKAGAEISGDTSRAGRSRGGAQAAIDVSLRLAELQDEYEHGSDSAPPEQVERMLSDLARVGRHASELRLPLDVAAAGILGADLLVWAGRDQAADDLLARSYAELVGHPDVPPTARTWQLIQLVRRRLQIAAAVADDHEVSRLAGLGIELIEQQRRRVSLPYLADSQLRDLVLVYVLGISAARKLGDTDLLLERADKLKARGALAWLPSPTTDVARLRAEIAADEAVIYWFWATPLFLLILTIDADGVEVEERRITEGQRAGLNSLVADIGNLRGPVRWLDTELPQLGALLLPAPESRGLLYKERLLLSPHGVLHGLPLHALDWDGAPLLARFAVTYIPCLAALSPRPSTADGPPIVVGIGGFPGGRAALPRAEGEAEQVAAYYPGADLLKGEDATHDALLARAGDGRLAGARLLHLATHGDDGPRDNPLAARVALADCDVFGADLREWPLAADLVVLSACSSARRAFVGRDGEGMFADEVYGLQSAFFAAGASKVLGGLWTLGDETAAATMVGFHRRLADGERAEDALRGAALDVRDRHPLCYDWAPYQLVAIGRPAYRREQPL